MLQYNSDEQKLNEYVDYSASSIIYGDDLTCLLQFSEDCIVICGYEYKRALVLSIPSMQKIKKFKINTEI